MKISNMSNERDITTDLTRIKGIRREFYKQLYANKFGRWQKNSLKDINLPEFIQEEIDT